MLEVINIPACLRVPVQTLVKPIKAAVVLSSGISTSVGRHSIHTVKGCDLCSMERWVIKQKHRISYYATNDEAGAHESTL